MILFYLQRTQSVTGASEDANVSSVTAVSMPAVNFSFFSPRPSANQQADNSQSTNQNTPPRNATGSQLDDVNLKSANENKPNNLQANELSPVQRNSNHQDPHALSSPGRDSIVSHSTEKAPDDVDIETAALSHLKQFQDYMSR